MNHTRSCSSDNNTTQQQWGKSVSVSSLLNTNACSMGSSPVFKAMSSTNIEERKSSLDKSKSKSILQSTNISTMNLNSIPNLTNTAITPTPAMHWKKIDPCGKAPPRSLRGHSMCMIEEKIYIFGGCDNKICYNDLYIFDADTNWWMHCKTQGTPPAPCRAHSCVALKSNIFFFGGGDGPTYYNDIFILDTNTLTWYKPKVDGEIPGARRAHSMWAYNNKVYIFAGGDGSKALNDVYVLTITPPSNSIPNSSVSATNFSIAENSPRFVGGGINSAGNASPVIGALSDRSSVAGSNFGTLSKSTGQSSSRNIIITSLGGNSNNNNNSNSSGSPNIGDYTYTWSLVKTTGKVPSPRGYHTSNIVGSKVIVFGGSDGHECFNDINILDLKTNHWSHVDADQQIPRLSHSSTQVGSYLFIIGGHDGMKYSREVLLLNLVTMNWETRKVYGSVPSGRGYHTAVLYDSRIYVFGGYDGHHVFNEMYA